MPEDLAVALTAVMRKASLNYKCYETWNSADVCAGDRCDLLFVGETETENAHLQIMANVTVPRKVDN